MALSSLNAAPLAANMGACRRTNEVAGNPKAKGPPTGQQMLAALGEQYENRNGENKKGE